MRAVDVRARAEEYRKIAAAARIECEELRAELVEASRARNHKRVQVLSVLVELAACRVRRHTQWANAYEEISLEIEEPAA